MAHSVHDYDDRVPPLVSGSSPASRSPYYNRLFWAGYKGTTRGMLGGIAIGGTVGAVVGLAAAAIGAALVADVAFGATAVTLVPLFAAFGMTFFKDLFGNVGGVAGTVAAGLEISEEREIARERMKEIGPDPDLQKIAQGGVDPYVNEPKPKHPYHWGIGLLGAAVGIAVALLLGVEVGLIGPAAAEAGKHVAIPLFGLITGGAAAGASYGVDRYYYRKLFNFFNDLYDAGAHKNADHVELPQNIKSDPELTTGFQQPEPQTRKFTERLPAAHVGSFKDRIASEPQADLAQLK